MNDAFAHLGLEQDPGRREEGPRSSPGTGRFCLDRNWVVISLLTGGTERGPCDLFPTPAPPTRHVAARELGLAFVFGDARSSPSAMHHLNSSEDSSQGKNDITIRLRSGVKC